MAALQDRRRGGEGEHRELADCDRAGDAADAWSA